MAKKEKNIKEQWAVVLYPADKLVSVCYITEVNEDDERIELISQHLEVNDAIEEQRNYAKENKLNPQY